VGGRGGKFGQIIPAYLGRRGPHWVRLAFDGQIGVRIVAEDGTSGRTSKDGQTDERDQERNFYFCFF